MNKKCILWFFVIAICSTIFALSNQPASISGSLSSRITTKIIEGSKEIKELQETKRKVAFSKKDSMIRDYAHFSLFLGLGIFAFLLSRSYKLRLSALLSMMFCILYALSDEYHQTFVPGRSFQLVDLYFDWFGSLTGIVIIALSIKIIIIFMNKCNKQVCKKNINN
jgi:VanZ family protein